nr:MAG TPA: hypothetical protein [Caudoviricetes sp.]
MARVLRSGAVIQQKVTSELLWNFLWNRRKPWYIRIIPMVPLVPLFL